MPLMNASSGMGRAAVIGWGSAAAVAMLAVWAAAQFEADIRPITPDRVSVAKTVGEADAARAVSLQPVVPRTLESYSTTRDRPLFEATRRPRPPQLPAGAAPEDGAADAVRTPAEALRIVGIMRPRMDASKARVLVRSADASQAVWLETGASIAGWTVSSIGDRTITVEGAGQRREISLFQSPAGGTN